MLAGLKIVVVSVLAAALYGVLHDQVTARVCLEYFTVAHADVVGHDPTIIGLYWGVVATWWVGLPLGVGMALASRAGSRVPLCARDLLPRLGVFLLALFGLAMVSGVVGYTTGRMAEDAPSYLDSVPSEHHAAFLFDGYAHLASYAGGCLGGVALMIWTFWSRPRTAGVRASG